MKGYGQFCPVAKAAEVLGERWTMLVVRELLAGSERFNDLRRGVPMMSPSLLSRRLGTLEEAGVLSRRRVHGQVRYQLTEAGWELRPMVEMMARWGSRWVPSQLTADDLDPALLMWDIRRNIDPAALPKPAAVVHIYFHDADKKWRNWWLVVDGGEVDLCLSDPGREIDFVIRTSVRVLTAIWGKGDSYRQARRRGDLETLGDPAFAERLDRWLGHSVLADV